MAAATFSQTPPALHGLCDDTIGLYKAGQTVPAGPCPNPNPNSGVGRDPCHLVQARPNEHAPAPNFRVCDTCHQSNRTNRWPFLWIDLNARRAIMCKECSKRLKRRNPNGLADACRCRDYICNPRTCYGCMDQKERATMRRGDDNRDLLLHTHKLRDRKTKKRKLVVDQPGPNVKLRKREACPTPGCGEIPWLRS